MLFIYKTNDVIVIQSVCFNFKRIGFTFFNSWCR